jgi:hypothetical protein
VLGWLTVGKVKGYPLSLSDLDDVIVGGLGLGFF